MKIKTLALLCAATGSAFLGGPELARAQICTLVEHTFTESFDNTTYKDPASSVGRWGTGEVILSAKGNSFDAAGESVGERVYVAAAGDWNADGWTDMVAVMLTPSCHIHFLRNAQEIAGVHQGFDMGGASGTAGFNSFIIDTPPGCSTEAPVLLAGDFDGDGDKDVLYMRVTGESNAGALAFAYVYRYDGLSAGVPQFTRFNVLAEFGGTTVAWHWTANVAKVTDINQDGYDDVLILSSQGTFNRLLLFRGHTDGSIGFQAPQTLIANLGFYMPIASATQAASGGSACPPAVSRGPSALMVGDFDSDNDVDVIAGSVSERDLKYWKNDGALVFTRAADISFPEGAAAVGIEGDFDGDGDLDLIVGRDGWNCNGVGGTAWFFLNTNGVFVKRNVSITSAGDDLDFGLAFHIDRDADNTLDVIVADGNNSGSYLKILGTKLGIYNLEGTAVSTVIDALANNANAIVSVKITGLTVADVNPPATTIAYYVSNDDGRHWEPVLPTELPPTSAEHVFTHYGSDFRWRAELGAAEGTLATDELPFAPAAKVTPRLRELAFSYYSVDRRQYTRSGLTYGVVNVSGTDREVIYSASYHYPGFEAYLSAWDISSLAAGGAGAGSLERVDTHANVSLLWEAGSVLDSRLASTRTIYASYPAGVDGIVNDRLSFTTTEVTSPSTTPSLQTMMAVSDPLREQVVRFVRGRMGDDSADRDWKFFGVGHSSPVFVDQPNADDAYMVLGGEGSYGTFKAAARDPQIYIGANDGMLHAFDGDDGQERWALIPYNLLARVKDQRNVVAGVEVYDYQDLVDGAVVVSDVYNFSTAQWRTVAVTGQANGIGRGDNNYYFAVDVTNPANPQPLWEFTDPADPYIPCSGNPCRVNCTETCAAPVCTSSCTAVDHVFNETGGAITMEAENFNNAWSVTGVHNWTVQTTTAGYVGAGYMEATPNSAVRCATNTSTTPFDCGAGMSFNVEITTAGTYYPFFRHYSTNSDDDSINWGVGGAWLEELWMDHDYGTWTWTQGAAVVLGAGEHVFNVWMREDGLSLDRLVLRMGAGAISGNGPAETCRQSCQAPVCATNCTSDCYGPGDEWGECGPGAGRECCGSPGEAFCAHVGTCAMSGPSATLGETWSRPRIGRIKLGAATRWVVFFASGYDNLSTINVGRAIYCLGALTGQQYGRWDIDDLATSATNPSTIDNTLPGGVALADVNDDGFVDRVYIGDLEGRLWRLNTSAPAVIDGMTNLINNWPLTNIFDAGLPTGSGNRVWAPIITTPAVAILEAEPNIFFGTGGDERAPGSETYRFFAVRDDATFSSPRYPSDLDTTYLEWSVAGNVGHKYWADPTIAHGVVVYFASLPGTIESVNPCVDIGGASNLYGYAIRAFADANGAVHLPGSSVLGVPYITANSKVRQAVLIRGEAPGSSDVNRPAGNVGTFASSDVIIQEFTSNTAGEAPPLQRIKEVGSAATTKQLKVLHWRELPL